MPIPDVSEALWDLTDYIQLTIIGRAVSDHEVVEMGLPNSLFSGILQPIQPQMLAIKPEGQRQWKWWTMWTNLDIDLDMIVQDLQGKQYRVMSKSDWRSGLHSGFFEYELRENPLR